MNKILIVLILGVFSIINNGQVLSHPGRTNSEGCHNNRATGEYHCHNETPGGSFGSGSSCSNFPFGDFRDESWLVSLRCRNGALNYAGRNLKTGDSISFTGAYNNGSSERHIYVWNNSGYKYQIAWRPNDPDFVRLQVFDTNNKELLNRLLSKKT
ncbi:MAG: YHYH domain-containing protein [Crocosphaera sp.]|nr:YHYH domain-containing protein [Crocosphaera sp.]